MSSGKRKARIEMLYDRVLISPIIQKKLPSGIIVPDIHKPDTIIGKVVSVGPGLWGDNRERIPLTVKKGDTVFYEKRYGVDITVDGETYTVMPEGHLAGIKRQ